jgi:ABC-type dipeptide/oligopeptide/nickel transport system permease subunit
MTAQPGDSAILHEDLGADAVPPPGSDAAKAIEGRSLSQIAWTRMRRDKVAMAGGAVVMFLILVAIFAPVIVHFLGHPPNQINEKMDLVDPDLGTPRGSFGGISSKFLLGVEPDAGLQRDVFSRIVYGARISLLIATLATAISVFLGILFGVVAGFYGGVVDAIISRVMDVFLAFPVLLFALSLVGIVQGHAFGLSGDTLHLAVIIFVIGFFAWPYMGRIVRGQVLSLKEREFVDAARSLGARGPRIILKELLPNLVTPILVYTTLLIPTNILFEAALSYLGVGIQEPTASWGGMLNQAGKLAQTDPTYLVVCSAAIFVTVLAFNLFGDGLRDAFDPKAR